MITRLTSLCASVLVVAPSGDTLPPPPLHSGGADTRASDTTLAGVCQPGDTGHCNGQGRCDADGAACVCDDPAHYSPEDDCRNWRQYVPLGDTFCTPGDRGPCHDHGTCDGDGHRCVCDDPEHYTPFDDCSHRWDEAPQPPDPDRPTDLHCEPGSRTDCHGNGQCNSRGSACICDDPDHYRPDDDCNFWHSGPEVPDDQHCEPGTRETCHGNGVCNADGAACICDDPEHYRPDDDCNTWHQGPEDDP